MNGAENKSPVLKTVQELTSGERIFSATWHEPDSQKLAVYERHGGYQALKKALALKPEEVVEEVRQANLRGRGGAGFPAGVKWGFLPKNTTQPIYLVVNADEGEPGTFKDRYILQKSPHLLLEGCAIACHAIKAQACYIYVRGEFSLPIRRLAEAIFEARQQGYLGENILGSGYNLEIYVHLGAGAYICGEETALLESLEGKKGQPRLKPPFPAIRGAFGCPTIVNNVETIAAVPAIIRMGGAAFARMGVEKNGGAKLYCVSGHVARPGVFELPHDVTLRQLIYDFAGGVRDDRPLKAVIPGGSSTPVLLPGEIDVRMDFDSLKAAGSQLGSAGVIVMDDRTCMVRALANLSHFYAHESCGQCTPCREGTPWMARLCAHLEKGQGTSADIDTLYETACNIEGQTICPLGDAAAWPVQNFVKKFRAEFELHVQLKKCPFPLEEVRPVFKSADDVLAHVSGR